MLRRVVVCALFLVMCSAAGYGLQWTWKAEQVDSEGQFASITADSQNNIHISYIAAGEGVKYGFRPFGSSQWFKMVVDVDSGFTRVTVDKQNNPHLCYNGDSRLKYAALVNHRWMIQEVNPHSGVIAYTCSLVVDSQGVPQITWYQEKGADGLSNVHLHYAALKDRAWLARTIDFEAQTGKWNSMLLDAQGHPHIAYDGFVNGRIKYAYYDGRKWFIRIVDERSGKADDYNLGMGNSLALDAAGNARIAYYTLSNLKYAHQDGDTWYVKTIDSVSPSISWLSFRSSILLDSHGFSHIFYEDSGTLKHAYWNGKDWNIESLVSGGAGGFLYHASTIDHHDTIYVAYTDPADGSLKVMIGRNSSRLSSIAEKTK